MTKLFTGLARGFVKVKRNPSPKISSCGADSKYLPYLAYLRETSKGEFAMSRDICSYHNEDLISRTCARLVSRII